MLTVGVSPQRVELDVPGGGPFHRLDTTRKVTRNLKGSSVVLSATAAIQGSTTAALTLLGETINTAFLSTVSMEATAVLTSPRKRAGAPQPTPVARTSRSSPP